MLRGLVHLYVGEPELGLRDSEEATGVARQVGPALHSGILVMEAQARMYCGDLDGAATQLAEAERIGAGVDTTRLRDRHGFQSELARLSREWHRTAQRTRTPFEPPSSGWDQRPQRRDLGGSP